MSAYRGRGRGRGGRGGKGGGGSNQLKGLFADGIWQCDCNPRLPANHFQVKKQNENLGKWFYTCQQPQGKQCGFFLFQDQAEPRERAAVLNNARTEPRSTAHVLDNRHNSERDRPTPTSSAQSPPPPYASPSMQQPQPISSSATRGSSDDFDDDTIEWPLAAEDQRRMEYEAIEATTPRKAVKTEHFTTPGRQPVATYSDHGLFTPETGEVNIRRGNLFGSVENATSLSKKRKADNDFLDLISPASTPTPAKFRDAEDADQKGVLFKEVSHALATRGVSMPDEAKLSLHQVCDRYDLRAQGIAKGREISRLALQARDAKISELQYRVNTLEAELETERAIVKHLRWENETDAR